MQCPTCTIPDPNRPGQTRSLHYRFIPTELLPHVAGPSHVSGSHTAAVSGGPQPGKSWLSYLVSGSTTARTRPHVSSAHSAPPIISRRSTVSSPAQKRTCAYTLCHTRKVAKECESGACRYHCRLAGGCSARGHDTPIQDILTVPPTASSSLASVPATALTWGPSPSSSDVIDLTYSSD